MALQEVVGYKDASYYLERRGVGDNNLLQILDGKDQKHGGRIHALFQRLQRKKLIDFSEGNNSVLLNSHAKIRWLDIGAGTAPIARIIKERYATVFDLSSLDVSAAGISLLSENERPAFVEGDVFNLPIRRDSLDILTAHDILEHLQDPMSAIAECYDVLKPGGLFQIVVPNPISETYNTDPTHIIPPLVSTSYFRTGLRAVGFRDVEVVTRGFGQETIEYFNQRGKELYKPEGGNHIYAFAWK
jgi:ubiquinone/menaquinone biosynthesis C-methylase UbiE